MASVARFGFEGGLLPSNVSIVSASFVSGRNGGTAVEGIAAGYTFNESVLEKSSLVSVESIDTNQVFFSCQYRKTNNNLQTSMSLVQFGNVWVEYDSVNSRVLFKRGKLVSPGYDILYTSPGTVAFPLNTWIPVSGKFVISASSGEISITIDGTTYSATALNTSASPQNEFTSTSATLVDVPPTVDRLFFSLYGAGGGGSDYGAAENGAAGGFVSGVVPHTYGKKYWAIAGQSGGGSAAVQGNGAGGTPGGGNGTVEAGGGGGYTALLTGSSANLNNVLALAGGGGGANESGPAAQAGGDPNANGTPFVGANYTAVPGYTGGGGAGYFGAATGSQGGSNYLAGYVLSGTSTQGGGSAGGIGSSAARGTAGKVIITGSVSFRHIYFGVGNASGNTLVGYPTFQLDDVAVNNPYTGSNSTGSFGVSDFSIPGYISCKLVPYTSTGSNTTGWNLPGGNITASISNTGSGQYLTSSFYPRPVLELSPSNVIVGANTVEGINMYFSGSYREGSSNAYIIPHFMLNDTSSVQGQNSFLLSSFQRTGSVSIFEKNLGGKLSYTEFLNGKVALDSTQWINKNFFGRGTLGDVRYTSSVAIPSTGTDYTILEYNNLIVDTGATLTVSGQSRGLIIYVKDKCLIRGTISMNGNQGASGSLSSGFQFKKNIASDTGSYSEYSSSVYPQSTLSPEQIFQPYLSGRTSELGITGSFSSGGVRQYSSNGNGNSGANGVNGNPGGGGGGGNQNSYGGAGGSSGTFSGGSGGGGAGSDNVSPGTDAQGEAGAPGVGGTGNNNGAGARGGGVIYIIANSIYNHGTISAVGGTGGASTSRGGGGGGGGGAIRLMYGTNYLNTGTITAAGGAGGIGGAGDGGAGGAGSITVTKILTN